jgi:hypothetical protein
MPKGTINGVAYEVPEGYRPASEKELRRGHDALRLLQDLSRSRHGRHEGDSEFQTEGGRSLGNDLLTTGQQIGYTIGGRPIVVPEHRERGNPEAWTPDVGAGHP